MKNLALALLLSSALAAPAFAADSPVYVGLQIGDRIVSGFAGYQIDKMYSVEAHYSTVQVPNINLPGIATTTSNSQIGVEGVAMFPLTINGAPNLSVFGKLGVERSTYTVDVAFANSPQLNNSITTTETKLTLGGGVQNAFTKNLSGRAGLGLIGANSTTTGIYIAGIYKF